MLAAEIEYQRVHAKAVADKGGSGSRSGFEAAAEF